MPYATHAPNVSETPRYDAERNALVAERRVRESGNSTVVTIPPQVLDAAGIEVGDTVQVAASLNGDGEIVLRRLDDDDEE